MSNKRFQKFNSKYRLELKIAILKEYLNPNSYTLKDFDDLEKIKQDNLRINKILLDTNPKTDFDDLTYNERKKIIIDYDWKEFYEGEFLDD